MTTKPTSHAFMIATDGYKLQPLPNGLWQLKSPSNAVYTLNPRSGHCNCPDFHARGKRRACKHLKALWALLKLTPWLERAAADYVAHQQKETTLVRF